MSGFHSGPTTGPNASEGANTITSRLNDLQIQINRKHPLIGTDDLPQLFVRDLVDDLDARATKTALANGLADKVTTTQLTESLSNRPTNANVATLLEAKENVLTDNSVPQSRIIGLATSLATLQTQINETATGELPDGSVAITKVGNLREELDARATNAALTAAIATREPLLVDEGVPQIKIAGLTAKLASLQAAVDTPVIADGALTIAKTESLQAELDARATTAALATKEPLLVDEGVPQSRIAGLTAKLASLTAGLADVGTTQIAQVPGLRDELDTKASVTALSEAVASRQPLILDRGLPQSKILFDDQGIPSSKIAFADEGIPQSKILALATALAGKQPTILDSDLRISQVSGLQAALNAAGGTIADGQLTIAKTSGLQGILDGKASTEALALGLSGKRDKTTALAISDVTNLSAELALKADTATVSLQLLAKQDVIADESLSQSKVTGLTAKLASLQTAVNSGNATIQDGALTFAKTSGLQAALDSKASTEALALGLAGKQATIQDGALTFAKTSGLQAALDSKATTEALALGLAGKQATIQDSDLRISQTEGLQAALDSKASSEALALGLAGKQSTIQDGDLRISQTAELQAALDSKQAALSDLDGTGVSLLFDRAQGVMRKIYGENGVVVQSLLDPLDLTDPRNFHIRVSATELQTEISRKQPLVTAEAPLAISTINGLQAALDSKGVGTSLTDGTGDGVSIIQNAAGTLRRITGVDGVVVALDDADQLSFSGQELSDAIELKQPLLTSSSTLTVDALTAKSLTAQNVGRVALTAGNTFASMDLGIRGISARNFLTEEEYTIFTNNAIPLKLRTNLQNSSVTALIVNVDNTCEFSERVTAPSLSLAGTDVLSAINGKSPLLTSLPGTGSSVIFDAEAGTMRKLYGHGGIEVLQTIDLEDATNPENFQLRVSGTALQNAIAALETVVSNKSPLLTNLPGTGVPLLNGSAQLKRVFGEAGILVDSPFNLDNPADPTNFQLRISGAALQGQLTAGLATKQNLISSEAPISISGVDRLQTELDLLVRAAVLVDALATKQDVISSAAPISISGVANLQTALNGKSPLLTSLAGTGSSIVFDAAAGTLRKLFGHGGIEILQTIDLDNPTNPENLQLRVSGATLQTSIQNLQTALEGKMSTLTTQDGTGVSIQAGSNTLRRITGARGITVSVPTTLIDPEDGRLNQVSISGVELQDAITALTTVVSSKSDTLTSLEGFGVSLLEGPSTLRRIFADSGLSATVTLNFNNPEDPKNFQLRISGAELQNQITTGLANLQTALNGKQNTLSTQDGTGVSLLTDTSQLRRLFGSNGITVSVPTTLIDPQDGRINQVSISGLALQNAIELKEPRLTSTSEVTIGRLTAEQAVTASAVTAEDASANTRLTVRNTSSHAASIFLIAGDMNAQNFAGFGMYHIGTNTAHPIVLNADRFNSTKGMTINPTNTVTIHKALTCEATVATGALTAKTLLVQDSVNHLSAFVHNTSAESGARASYKLQSAGSGMMQYVSATEFVIGTDNAIPIRLRPNRLNTSVVTALNLNTDGTSSFGAAVTCPQITVGGVDILVALSALADRLLALENANSGGF